MASYTQNSDLVTHYSPSQYHPKSSNTAAVYDANQNPMVFSIAADSSKLMLTKADPVTGNNGLIDLSAAFGLTGEITHLTSTQDDSSNIYVVFAEAASEASGTSNIHVCASTSPNDWTSSNLKTILIPPAASTPQVSTERLCLLRSADGSDFFDDSTYPLTMVVFNTPETNTPQIQRIRVTTDDQGNSTWSFVENELTMTVNPLQLIDLTVLSPGDGKMCLATISVDASKTLLLETANYDTNFPSAGQTTTRLVAPDGAAALSSLQNADGYHDLLVGGNGLFHFHASDLSKSNSTASNLTPKDPFFIGVQNMTTSQSQSSVTIWSQTSANVINSLITVPDDSSQVPVATGAVPIVPGTIQSLTPIFHAASQSHKFLFLDESGNHNLLQHKPVNDIWDEQLWVLPEVNGSMQAISAYMSYITFTGADGRLATNTSVSITASDLTAVELNGTKLSLGPSPVSTTTDSSGTISMIIPTTGLGGANIITLSLDGKVLSPNLDPGQPAKERLGKVTDLGSVQLPDGSQLVDPSIGTALIKDASDKVSALHGRLSSVPADGSVEPDTEGSLGGLFDDFWKAFHWIEKEGKKADDWVRNKAGHIIAFTINLAESGPVKFLVNSIERCIKAIEWVVNLIKVEIDKLIAWLGLWFDWKKIQKQKEDMLQTSNSVTSQIGTWAEELASEAVACVDQGIQALETLIEGLRKPSDQDFAAALTTGIAMQTSNPGATLPPDANGPAQTASQSTGVSWSRYQLTHGNILSGAVASAEFAQRFVSPVLVKTVSPHSRMVQFQVDIVEGAEGVELENGNAKLSKESGLAEKPTFDPKIVEDFVTDIIIPASQEVEAAIIKIISDLSNLFGGPLDGIGQKCLDLIIDGIEGVLNTFRTVLNGVLKIFNDVFSEVLSSIINGGIQIPFLSTLYKFFTGEDLPGMLDITCLLIAIPSNVLGNIIAGAGNTFWPDISGFAETLSSLQVPSISTALATIISGIEEEAPRRNTSYARTDPDKPKPGGLGDNETNWKNYSRACIVVHPVGVGLEIAASVTEIVTDNIEGPVFLIAQLIANIGEWLCCSFSFPNQSAAVVTERSESKNANILTCLNWGLRVTEAIVSSILLLYVKLHSEATKLYVAFKATLDILGTELTFIFSLTACILRAVGNSKDLAASVDDPDEHARLEKEKVAIGIEFGNTFSSLLEQFLDGSGKLIPEEFEPIPSILDIGSVIFGVADFALDVGRGSYQYANGLTYRPVLF